jgi:pyruvate dehydrogenase E1 component beta subunit
MFGGQSSVPLVVRMIIGRGWGQGPQHSQALHAWFAHIPGLKVVMPGTPYDAKGLLISAVEDNNPVIFLEHRWLHNITGQVPEGHYTVPLGKARVAGEGNDVTIIACSHMLLEALRAAEILQERGISAEVVDLRTISPLDRDTIRESVEKTGRLVVADIGTTSFGIGAEIISGLAELSPSPFLASPSRIALPDLPTPTSPALARHYYPRAAHIASAALAQFGIDADIGNLEPLTPTDHDVPDKSFCGPF